MKAMREVEPVEQTKYCPYCNDGVIVMAESDFKQWLLDQIAAKELEGQLEVGWITRTINTWKQTGGRVCPECGGRFTHTERG